MKKIKASELAVKINALVDGIEDGEIDVVVCGEHQVYLKILDVAGFMIDGKWRWSIEVSEEIQ